MNIEGYNTGSASNGAESLCDHLKQFFNTLIVLDITVEAIDSKIKVKCEKCQIATIRRDFV